MIDKQRKMISNGNIGRDSHVRSYQGNIFKPQSSQTFQMLAGEISMTEPEPLFRQDRRKSRSWAVQYLSS